MVSRMAKACGRTVGCNRLVTGRTPICGMALNTPWMKLDQKVREMLLFGTGSEKMKMTYSSQRWTGTYTGGWEGAIPNLMRRYKQTKSGHIQNWIEQFMSMRPCSECNGARLRIESRSVFINEMSLGDVASLSIKGTLQFFENIQLNKKITNIVNLKNL